jgi:hypothetical protein
MINFIHLIYTHFIEVENVRRIVTYAMSVMRCAIIADITLMCAVIIYGT